MFTICSTACKPPCHYILYDRNQRDKAFLEIGRIAVKAEQPRVRDHLDAQPVQRAQPPVAHGVNERLKVTRYQHLKVTHLV